MSSTASLVTVVVAWAIVLIAIAIVVRVGPEQFNRVD